MRTLSDRRRREASRTRIRPCEVPRVCHRTAVKQRRCTQQILARGRRTDYRTARNNACAFLSGRASSRTPTSVNCFGGCVRAQRRGDRRYGCTLPSAAGTRLRACTRYVQCSAHARRSFLSRGRARASCSHAGQHAPPSGRRIGACARTPPTRFSAHALRAQRESVRLRTPFSPGQQPRACALLPFSTARLCACAALSPPVRSAVRHFVSPGKKEK